MCTHAYVPVGDCDYVCMLSGYVSVKYLLFSSGFHLLKMQFYVVECAVRKIKIV